jgi:integrase/recombinase XerC
MTDDDLIRAHHVDQVRRGNLPRSIARRDANLATFVKWLQGKPLLEVTRTDVERFLDARDIGPRTRYGWLSHLHAFYDWAARDELTEHDPTSRIIRPKMRRTLPRPADTDELLSALGDACPKHRCWLLLAAYQGLRCQEIAGLRREDVLEAEGLLRVAMAKGGNERLLPLHPDVLEALKALPMPRVGWVFRRPRGGPYGPVALSQEFNRFLRDAGVDATAHHLRHWFGTSLYMDTHDLRLVQEMLGHASPTTTAIYTAFDQRAAGEAVRALGFAR